MTKSTRLKRPIDYSDIPELPVKFWREAKIVIPDRKVPVSLRLDQTVLNWFKKQGKGYQSRINAILAAYMQAQQSR
ncbi:hypothetical protein A2W24_05085 [Microgenomates group bacterium RBG_16_45_19]|nr:MAG: hypothetical protein A2W24_05085 [Microgenomates group bacterium RBG_16_45_19]